MMKLKVAAVSVAFALGLAACSHEASAPEPTQVQQNDTQQLSSGLFLSDYDRSIRPQDDLFMFVNGAWYQETDIPSDRSRYGAFDILALENEKRLHGIIQAALKTQAAVGSNQQKLADYYGSFMNEEQIESVGLTPVQPFLSRIQGATSHQELTTVMAELVQVGVGVPFGYYAYADAKNPSTNILYIAQSGLGLSDRDYYFHNNESFEALRVAYVKYVADMLTAIGHDHPDSAAQQIFDLEKRIAEHHWTREQRRDADASYNKMTAAEFDALIGNFDFAAFADKAHLGAATELIVRMPSYFEAFSDIFTSTSVETWQDYLQLRTMSAFASRLSSQFADLQFDFYSKTVNGIPEQQERWKRAVQATNYALGEVLGQEYVAQYFPPEAKARMEDMIGHIIFAMDESIQELEWMSAETKKKAQDKLSKFTPKIGYPDQWRDYSGLEVLPNDLFGNSLRVAQFNYEYNIGDIGQPVDKDRWGMTPQTVNAYYSPTGNEIVFPAGILQPPFFNLEADDAVNYGGIGAVIGHEIGHGFDDQGSRYDGDGNLSNWWTEADRQQFDAKTGMLVHQYSQFEPLPGLFINGKTALGENIGDHVGLITAYRAYKHSLEGKPSTELDGFTGEQRLFLSWAQVWKIKFRDDAMREQISSRPHAPGQYRAIGAPRNIPGFYEAFGVTEGDGMYLPPEERVKLW